MQIEGGQQWRHSAGDRKESEFQLNEANLRRATDGTLEGSLWVIYVRTGRGMAFYVDRLRSNWLDSSRNAFAARHIPSRLAVAAIADTLLKSAFRTMHGACWIGHGTPLCHPLRSCIVSASSLETWPRASA